MINNEKEKQGARMEKQAVHNSKCVVEYDPERKEIFARDLTDTFNEPAIYSKTKRGIRAAWDELTKTFTPETRLHDVVKTLEAKNIRTHYWCMVD